MSDKIINCEFEFKCPLNWNNLQKQENESVRFCTNCQKNVYFAHSQGELDELAKAGKCVAFNQTIEDNDFKDSPPPTMGMIAPPPDYPIQTPPLPPECIPTMGLPTMPPKEKPFKKKPWWKPWE